MKENDPLLDELEILTTSSIEDFEKEFWANYEKYLAQYNTILQKIHEKGLCKDIKPMDPVLEGDKAAGGSSSFTASEKGKLREIANAAQILSKRLIPESRNDDFFESALERLEQVCNRFHIISRQLRSRHNGRNTLEVEDEYDVQDLMHTILVLDFEDIRPEEWTPSYAGGSARVDFLLKKEQIIIETKKTRKGIADREIGEQLIIDIEKYQEHPDCKTLVCFVYDPEGRIANPRGVESDLESRSKEITLRVFIRPTGM